MRLNLSNFFASIVLPLSFAIAGVSPAMAEENKIDPLTQIMIDTWEPTPSAALQLMSRSDSKRIVTELDRFGINSAVTSLYWQGCQYIFQVSDDDPLCRKHRSPGSTFYDSLWEYVTNGNFITTVDHEFMARTVIKMVGAGRTHTQLKPLMPLFIGVYEPKMALDYQRWRANWCNFLFISGDSYGQAERREGKPGREECLADPFAVYLTTTYCAPAEKCDLGQLSWGYGFLTRRYMWGGDDAVVAWQQAMYTMAKQVNIAMPAPHWDTTATSGN